MEIHFNDKTKLFRIKPKRWSSKEKRVTAKVFRLWYNFIQQYPQKFGEKEMIRNSTHPGFDPALADDQNLKLISL